MLLTFFGNAAILIVEIVVVEMDSCPDSNSLVEDRLSSFFCNKSSVYGVGDSTKSKSISREETVTSPNHINIYVKPPFFAIYIIEILKFI